MRQKRERTPRQERATRESDWLEVDALWIPPEFKARMEANGFSVRWLRYTEGTDKVDRRLAQRFHRGWQFVKPDQCPEWKEPPTIDFGRFQSLISVGDLALAMCPKSKTEEDNDLAEDRASRMWDAVKSNLQSLNDAKMPIYDNTKISTGRQTRFAD